MSFGRNKSQHLCWTLKHKEKTFPSENKNQGKTFTRTEVALRITNLCVRVCVCARIISPAQHQNQPPLGSDSVKAKSDTKWRKMNNTKEEGAANLARMLLEMSSSPIHYGRTLWSEKQENKKNSTDPDAILAKLIEKSRMVTEGRANTWLGVWSQFWERNQRPVWQHRGLDFYSKMDEKHVFFFRISKI